MLSLAHIAQIIVAGSIVLVWVFRFPNVVNEFHEYGLPDLIRNMVGATKIALSTLLVAGIWYPGLVLVPALMMAGLMVCAQIAHVKVHHPVIKYLPSAFLLVLSLYIAAVSAGYVRA